MATSTKSKQSQSKNLSEDMLERLKVAEANLESFKLTGLYHFLKVTIGLLEDIESDLD
jgi:hypothetical protein